MGKGSPLRLFPEDRIFEGIRHIRIAEMGEGEGRRARGVRSAGQGTERDPAQFIKMDLTW